MQPSNQKHRSVLLQNLDLGTIARACFCTLAVTALSVSIVRAFEDEESEAPEVGVRGILPFEAPVDLTIEAFEVFDGNWKQWGAEVADQVQKLYEGEDLDLKAQRALLDDLQKKVKIMDSAIADRRYRLLHDQLTGIRGRMARRVNFASAVLDTLEQDAAQVHAARIETSGKQVVASAVALQTNLAAIPGGSGWFKYVGGEDVLTLGKKPNETDKAIPKFEIARKKIAGRDKLENETQRAFLGRPEFLALERTIGEYITAANAEIKTVDKEALRETLANLSEALELFEEEGLSEYAVQIPAALDAVATAAADDGKRVGDVVRSHYLNSNLQLIASEKFLSRLVHEERNDKGPVRDQVQEATITGTQSTKTVISIDTRANSDGGLFYLTLSGRTQSQTAAATPRATIYSQGDHRFWAFKPVNFDGYRLKTYPATIRVEPSTHHYDATVYGYESGLFSGTARNRALNIANQRRGQARDHSRRRITERVLPEFEKKSEEEMRNADQRLQGDLQKRLKEADVFPHTTNVSTTDTELRMRSTVSNKGELSGGLPATAYGAGDGMVLQLHESLLNNVLSRMNFSGRTMTDTDIKQEIERFASILAGREIKFDSSDDSTADTDAKKTTGRRAFIFEKEDPIRVRFEDGKINLILRTGFEQEGKDNIPAQQVTIPLTYRIEKDKITVEKGNVMVAAIGKVESGPRQIVFAGVMRKKIEKSIPNRTRERVIKLEREGKDALSININDVKALNGWLIIRAK